MADDQTLIAELQQFCDCPTCHPRLRGFNVARAFADLDRNIDLSYGEPVRESEARTPDYICNQVSREERTEFLDASIAVCDFRSREVKYAGEMQRLHRFTTHDLARVVGLSIGSASSAISRARTKGLIVRVANRRGKKEKGNDYVYEWKGET